MVPGRGIKVVVVLAAVAIMMSRGKASAQVLTNTSNGVLSESIPFGNLTPGTSTAPASTQVQFRVRSNNDNGYRILVSAVFNVTPTALVQGGTTVSASDIGVGISSIVPGNATRTPRVDTIATGFNYDPATVTAVNGLTPYNGSSSGSATLADIIANPNMTILSGPRIANNQGINNQNNFLTVTITFGLVGQFFTPSTLSGILTVTLVDGP
jgi:hypothetical protein